MANSNPTILYTSTATLPNGNVVEWDHATVKPDGHGVEPSNICRRCGQPVFGWVHKLDCWTEAGGYRVTITFGNTTV